MNTRWNIMDPAEPEKILQLSKDLNDLNPRLCNILIQRGIDTLEKAKYFFRPDLNFLHDPFLMKDMDKAVERLELAFSKGENILIYGDYDVDGTTSVAMMYKFLIQHYDNLDYYIPDRYAEGYGISFQGIDYAEDNGISLIIALDCGIKAIEKIAYANEKNIDFIICDHHNPGEKIPDAVAVLDPKRNDCNYPFKELSGCGVGFKLLQAWTEKNKLSKENLFSFLDFLAISIAADIVPIVGENRILCYFGLNQLNENPHLGFKTMLNLANFKKARLNVMDVVFTLAPRINAAGRMESGRKAVELMISDKVIEAHNGSNAINENNLDRRVLDTSITKEALSLIAQDKDTALRKTTVLYQEHWHKGVIGIVASRCIENYYRPTIILTESHGEAAGSARSVKGFNVYEAIEKCSDLLTQFGGHKYAAGLTLPIKNIPAFQKKFEQVVASSILDEQLIPEIDIDSEINFDEINEKFYKVLKLLAPFGPQNMRPVFISKNLKDKGFAKIVGERHLKFEAVNPESGISIPCIAFGLSDQMRLVQSGKPFDIAFSIEENEWNGNITLQLMVKGIRASEV